MLKDDPPPYAATAPQNNFALEDLEAVCGVQRLGSLDAQLMRWLQHQLGRHCRSFRHHGDYRPGLLVPIQQGVIGMFCSTLL